MTSDPFLTVSAAGLRAAGVSLSAAEAVACVLLTGEALNWASDAPDPRRVILRGDGRISIRGGATAADGGGAAGAPVRVDTYARLLHRLLPEGGDAGQTPGALRLTIARGIGALDAPPFSSIDDFRIAIARFISDPPEHLIVAAVVRWAEATGSLADERLPERRAAGPRVDTLRRMLREADLERYALVTATAHVQAPVTPLPEREPDVDSPAPPVFAAYDPVPERPVKWGAFAAVAAIAAVLGWGAAVTLRDAAPVFAPDAVHIARHDPGAGAPVATSGDPADGGGSEASAGVRAGNASSAPESAAPGQDATEASALADVPAAGGAPAPDDARAGHGDPSWEASAAAVGPFDAADRLAETPVAPGALDADRAVSSHWSRGTEERTVIDAGMVTYSGFRLANVIDGTHHTDNVRLAPDGSRVAFDSDRDGERGVYIAKSDGTEVKRVSGEGYARAPAWSPNSRRLAFLRGEPDGSLVRNLWVKHLETGEERRVTAWRYGEMSAADWFPDGRRLCYAHDGRIYVMDLNTGAARSYDPPIPGRNVGAIAASPDGTQVAFQVLNDGVWLLDLRDGSRRRLLADPAVEQLAWSPTGSSLAYHSRSAGQWAVLMLSER